MRIAITIRMYRGERYNTRVYHQRCKACNSLSRPILDDSYAKRVAYRLKKWCGVELERPEFSGQSKGPHEAKFCEGCKAGHCGEGRRIDDLVRGVLTSRWEENEISSYRSRDLVVAMMLFCKSEMYVLEQGT
jgi:hypothetical protein